MSKTRRDFVLQEDKKIVKGYSEECVLELELHGGGFSVSEKDEVLCIDLGFSHLIYFSLPLGVKARVMNSLIQRKGEEVGLVKQTAQRIRRLRPLSRYSVKGVQLVGGKKKRFRDGGKRERQDGRSSVVEVGKRDLLRKGLRS